MKHSFALIMAQHSHYRRTLNVHCDIQQFENKHFLSYFMCICLMGNKKILNIEVFKLKTCIMYAF